MYKGSSTAESQSLKNSFIFIGNILDHSEKKPFFRRDLIDREKLGQIGSLLTAKCDKIENSRSKRDKIEICFELWVLWQRESLMRKDIETLISPQFMRNKFQFRNKRRFSSKNDFVTRFRKHRNAFLQIHSQWVNFSQKKIPLSPQLFQLKKIMIMH